MTPENPYESPQHSSPVPLEMMDSVEFGKRRRFWTWMSFAPAVLPLLGVLVAVTDRGAGEWLMLLIVTLYAVPLWLILCACLVPAPRHYQHTWQRVLWKIGWYFLFIIIHIVILYAAVFAGCSLMPTSSGSWH
jgi:hypothetical protein